MSNTIYTHSLIEIYIYICPLLFRLSVSHTIYQMILSIYIYISSYILLTLFRVKFVSTVRSPLSIYLAFFLQTITYTLSFII